ncbi:MAG: hypothetical protein H6581_26100 [Bacteroidia bacterium]|nr:hypothetical protein [Bacteroidia bacterium]
MKSPNPDLWTLLQTLDQAEKRYCNLYLAGFTSKKEKYLRLFSALLKMEVYDERALLKKTDFKSRAQLANAKHFLQDQIHKALLAYHKAGNIIYQTRDMISLSEILMKKGLTGQGMALLDSAIENAREYELIEVMLDASRIKLVRLVNIGAPSVVLPQSAEIIRNQKEILEDLQKDLGLLEDFFLLYQTVRSQGLKQARDLDFDRQESFWLEKLEGMGPFRDKIMASTLSYWIFNAFGEKEIARRFFLRSLQLFEEHPRWKVRLNSIYSSGLYNMAIFHLNARDFGAMEKVISGLKILLQELSSHPDKTSRRLVQLRTENLERLLICFGDESRINSPGWKIFEKNLPQARDLELEFLLTIRSLDIAILFLRREYAAARKLTHDTLNKYPAGLPENGKLRLRTLSLIIFYVQGDIDLLDLEGQNLQKKLSRFPAEKPFFAQYIRLLKNLSSSHRFQDSLKQFLDRGWSGPELTSYQQASKMVFDRMLRSLIS